MTKFTTRITTILVLTLFVLSTNLIAQDNPVKQDKKTCEKSCTKGLLKEMQSVKGEKVDMHISTEDGSLRFTAADDTDATEMIMFMRQAKSKTSNTGESPAQFRVFLSEDEKNEVSRHHHEDNRTKTKKLLLGIYVDDDNGAEGLKIGRVIEGKGAAMAGLQRGDVITKINEAYINNIPDLRIQLSKFKAGDEINVQYTRAEKTLQTLLVLVESEYSSYERSPCKVFIGVRSGYDGEPEGGMKVTGVIEGWPAEKAGIKVGDVILSIDEVDVHTHKGLVTERDNHAPGDYFTLSILREGIPLEIEAQFRSCEDNVIEKVKTVEEETPAISSPIIESENELLLETYNTFPNPTYGKVTLEFKTFDAPTTIQILDVTGKVVYKEELMHFSGYYKKELNLQNANPGTIIINIIQDDKVVSKKIVLLSRA